MRSRLLPTAQTISLVLLTFRIATAIRATTWRRIRTSILIATALTTARTRRARRRRGRSRGCRAARSSSSGRRTTIQGGSIRTRRRGANARWIPGFVRGRILQIGPRGGDTFVYGGLSADFLHRVFDVVLNGFEAGGFGVEGASEAVSCDGGDSVVGGRIGVVDGHVTVPGPGVIVIVLRVRLASFGVQGGEVVGPDLGVVLVAPDAEEPGTWVLEF